MQWPYALSLVNAIVFAFIFGVGQLSPEFRLTFSNILFPTTAGVAMVEFMLGVYIHKREL